MFKVVKRLKAEEIKAEDCTKHYQEKEDRIRAYKELKSGRIIASFLIDKGHSNGYEVHNLYSNRIIRVYNNNSKKAITLLYAREGQIKRYFKNAPLHLFDDFIEGYNYK